MAEKTDALIPVDQREVTFYEDTLTAIRTKDGQIYVAIRQMCEALGLDQRSQRRRIQRHHVLAQAYQRGVMMTPHRGRQEAGMLRADVVPLWLSGIDTSRVKEEIRPKLEKYQIEVAKVLWEAFQEGRLTTDPTFDELLQQDTEAVQAYKMIQAMLRLARHQVLIEARLDKHEERLEQIEAQLGDPARYVTPAQATAVSQAVKAIALILSKQTRRNEYGAVFGELYRRYNVPSYRELPAYKYQECLDWLNEWKAQLESDSF